MSREMGRDDFVISARSVFLNKGNRQKFSLLTLIIISIVILSLEYFKSGPVNQIRMIAKDIIIKSSNVASVPFKSISNTYFTIVDHFKMYEEYEKLKIAEIKKQNLMLENNFFKEENQRLKKLINEKNLYNDEFYITKVLLDQKSPYLRSLLINKGFKHGIKLGAAVRSDSYFIGKIVDSNYLTSRILLISDLNSKIPVIIEPGSISAILSGTGDNELGEIEYLPENNNIKEGGIVYTSGSDGIISSGIPIGKIILENNLIKVDYFTDFTQINFVKVYYKK
ncbi:rod shape-determining protein MreC [Candidatus Pelagibacter sp.]|nr:rod shape-determining protein MreC [Candidatus Pelagibacter sp.]